MDIKVLALKLCTRNIDHFSGAGVSIECMTVTTSDVDYLQLQDKLCNSGLSCDINELEAWQLPLVYKTVDTMTMLQLEWWLIETKGMFWLALDRELFVDVSMYRFSVTLRFFGSVYDFDEDALLDALDLACPVLLEFRPSLEVPNETLNVLREGECSPTLVRRVVAQYNNPIAAGEYISNRTQRKEPPASVFLSREISSWSRMSVDDVAARLKYLLDVCPDVPPDLFEIFVNTVCLVRRGEL